MSMSRVSMRLLMPRRCRISRVLEDDGGRYFQEARLPFHFEAQTRHRRSKSLHLFRSTTPLRRRYVSCTIQEVFRRAIRKQQPIVKLIRCFVRF